MTAAQVAFSKDFLESYSSLPKKIQKKVREFTEKFQRDPTQPGLNFERLEGARDPKVRSVRIDQAYRAIVIHPPKGDVFLCAWVDHHDEAYAWVRNRQFEVNPRSGCFQVFELTEGTPPAEEPAEVDAARVPVEAPRLFDSHDDEDLLLAGVPSPLLASIRALNTEADLDELAPHIPPDASEMLYLLAAGYDLLDAIEEAERSAPAKKAVDTADFAASLSLPDTQQTFRIIEDEAQLEAILDAPLDKWRVFLHPAQEKLVKMNANGPVRVLGGAGTGKTVVLMHRARYLAEQVFTGEGDRILVTTYTRNLALDLKMNLRNLCSKEAFARLEITNIHSWAAGFMRRQGHSFQVAKDHESEKWLDMAIAECGDDQFTHSFYRSEWEDVVQAQDVASRDDYLTARRVGRGTRLSKKQRAAIWGVFERYRALLDENSRVEWPDAVRETRLFIENNNIALPYASVLSDEVQDFTASELRLLRTLAPDSANTLFLVGDGHQRIYGQPVKLGSCGIEIRGRSRRLKLNYRTTEQIGHRAVGILSGKEVDDLDGGVDTLKGYSSLRRGPEPVMRHFAREAEELKFITETVKGWSESVKPEAICIAARTGALIRDRYAKALEAAGINCLQVETDPETEAQQDGVRLATMHRLKGLEYQKVLLVGVQEGTVPLVQSLPVADEELRDRHELRERCLLYVACTRARDELVITGYGTKSPFLESNDR